MIVFELSLLMCVIFITLSIVWSTLQTGISPMISSRKAREVIISSIDRASSGPIFDLGSGWGSLIIPIAKKYPDQKIIGYELSLVPFYFSLACKHLLRLNNLQIYRKDFHHMDFKEDSILICYLFPQGMTTLYNRILDHSTKNCMLISNTFALESLKATNVITLDDMYKTQIYIYHLPS